MPYIPPQGVRRAMNRKQRKQARKTRWRLRRRARFLLRRFPRTFAYLASH